MQNQSDPFAQFKAIQREGWGLFAPLEVITTIPAALLIDYAEVKSTDRVLDVGCGTGVAAVTAARRGAKVKGLDLSPVLLERAKFNALTAEVEVGFTEGDVEALPFENESFDVVVSQFGHMFAPRPEVAVSEMLRVLKPGGRIAFSTWPPELYTGKMFTLMSKHLPPPPGAAAPPLWGDPAVIRERLGQWVTDLSFTREELHCPALSAQHVRMSFENTAAPVIKVVEAYKNDAAKLAQFRKELESLISSFMKGNTLRQHFLISRAKKA